MICIQMRTKFIPICGYSPEVRAFGTLVTSTKVLDNLQNSLTTPPKTILYLEFETSYLNNCRLIQVY